MTQKLVQLVNGGLETNILRLSSNEHLSGMLNLRIRKGLSEKGDWIWKEEYKLRNGGKKKKGGEDTPINLGMQWQEMVVGT